MAVKDKLATLEDLQAAYDDLKEMISGMDMSTENITLVNTMASDGATVTKSGNMVQIDIRNLRLASSTTVSGTIGTVPAGYRPNVKICLGAFISSSNTSVLTIDTDGTIATSHAISSGLNYAAFYHDFYYCAVN